MNKKEKITRFMQAECFAVVGASVQRHKYGNKVLRCYQEHGYKVVPVNPGADEVEGLKCAHSVAELPSEVEALSIITPPGVTRQAVHEAIARGIKHIWMQPGAEDESAIALCHKHGINIIADGSCILVVLGFSSW